MIDPQNMESDQSERVIALGMFPSEKEFAAAFPDLVNVRFEPWGNEPRGEYVAFLRAFVSPLELERYIVYVKENTDENRKIMRLRILFLQILIDNLEQTFVEMFATEAFIGFFESFEEARDSYDLKTIRVGESVDCDIGDPQTRPDGRAASDVGISIAFFANREEVMNHIDHEKERIGDSMQRLARQERFLEKLNLMLKDASEG